MKIILNKSMIQVAIGDDKSGLTVTENVLPDDALRYAKTLRQLADQLINEFRNEEEDHERRRSTIA